MTDPLIDRILDEEVTVQLNKHRLLSTGAIEWSGWIVQRIVNQQPNDPLVTGVDPAAIMTQLMP